MKTVYYLDIIICQGEDIHTQFIKSQLFQKTMPKTYKME